jgi:shikimate dehydrogenase
MVIGDPITHSLSPAMHNAGFKACGIYGQFVFLGACVKINDISQVPKIMKILGIRGMSLTSPHKIEIMKHLKRNHIEGVAQKIGAVNTLVNDEDGIKGFNTDWIGILKPLEELISLPGKKVAIIGVGGVAKAAAFAFSTKRTELIIFGRDNKKINNLAVEFDGVGRSLNNLEEISKADIIFNATPVGMHPDIDKTPVPKELINEGQIIFDAVYFPKETRLLKEAKQKGAKTISGLELLLYQGFAQFELFTGKKAPITAMRRALR